MPRNAEPYQAFLRRPIAALMVFFAVLFLGTIASFRLPVELLPDLAYPRVLIYTAATGLSADEVERRIVVPQESLLAGLPQLRSLNSVADQGYGLVSLEFTRIESVETTILDIREKLASFPRADPIEEPSVLHHDPNTRPVATLAVTGDEEQLAELTSLALDVFVRRLTQLDGVGSVSVIGGQTLARTLELDSALLAARGVPREHVEQVLASRITRLGSVREGRNTYSIRLVEGSVGDLSEISIPGTPYRVGDLGTITTTVQSDGMVATNGRRGLALLVSKRYGANTVRLVESIRALLPELRQIADAGGAGEVSVSVAFQEATFIRDAMRSVATAFGFGGALTFLVLVVLLGSLRQGLAVGMSIPVSVAATGLLFHLQGVSLNIMSLGGLALGIGMMVDNGVVVSEAVHRQMRLSTDRVAAVHRGVAEVAAPITASTLTTVAVFVPIVFLSGPTALLFRDLALAVTYSLALSLMVSLTLLPVLLAQIGGYGRMGRTAGRVWDTVEGRYRGLLGRLCRRALSVVLGAIVLIGLAIWGSVSLPVELLPESGQQRLEIAVTAAPGTTTESLYGKLRGLVQALPGAIVERSMVFASRVRDERVGITLPVSNEGRIRLLVSADVTVAEAREEVAAALAAPAAAYSVSYTVSPELNPLEEVLRSGTAGSVLRLSGPAESEFVRTAEAVGEALRQSVGRDPATIAGLALRPVYLVSTRPEVLAAERLNALQVVDAVDRVLAVRTVGRIDGDMLVRFVDARSIADALDAVVAVGGRSYAVGDLVEITESTASARISRVDQRRAVDYGFETASGDGGTLDGRLERAAAEVAQRLPEGYSFGPAGETQEARRSLGRIGWSFVVAAVLVYMIMAAQFESLLLPLIVMLSVPFALTGVVALFFATGTSLNIMSAIGATVALGIVINDAIILVSAVGAGSAVDAAVRRMRPIVITTVTTVAGMLPLALGGEAAARLRVPLAMAVIGGLSAATVLTLVVLPVVLARLPHGRFLQREE